MSDRGDEIAMATGRYNVLSFAEWLDRLFKRLARLKSFLVRILVKRPLWPETAYVLSDNEKDPS